ncbi:hypothetical protein Poli38472_004836 [Pythium oligandrum]|uniref:Uncharacterized protein n=1 Tax=Pythium oligandrum TaxID=41045 RepID=A0A8K1CAU2_PYTOL|nr:hypothetical protein Poli38472_004836 [Pythium oligandrum]|eukprot:TMW59767.1 hypothetical protein Poli38472_004836 [Pythium oligandrum]
MRGSGEASDATMALPQEARVDEIAHGSSEMVFDPTLAFIDDIDSTLLHSMDAPGPNPHVEEMIDQADALLREMLTAPDVADALASPRLDSSSASADESVKSTPVKKTKLSGPARQKREMAYLRQHVEELEADLDRLKKRKTVDLVTRDAMKGEKDGDAWKEMAERQRLAKQRAEMENMKLREALEDQLKIAQSLEKVLSKRMNTTSDDWGNVKPKNVFAPFVNSDSVYQVLRQSLASNPVPVDALIRECGLDQVHTDFKNIKSECTDGGDLFLEVVTCRRLPFPLKTTADAAWHAVNVAPRWRVPNESSGASPPFGRESRLHFTATRAVRRSNLSMDVYMMARHEDREDEEHRAVFTWESRAFLTTTTSCDSNIRVRERGYMVVERDPAKPETSSLIKWCMRTCPEIEESTSGNRQFELIIDLLLGTHHDNMQTMYEQVESKLLDDARAQQLQLQVPPLVRDTLTTE